MKNKILDIIKLFKESNRPEHFMCAIPIGFVFTILCVLGVASGMEFKDKLYSNNWDWLDWTSTILGGIVGQILQVLVLLLITHHF